MKFQLKKSVKAQKGFTLVELSVVVLVAGLMLTAVMKGQSMLETARAQNLYNDIKNVESLLGQYESVKGRLPGDCNSDGLMGFSLNANGGSTASSTINFDRSAANQALRAELYSQTALVTAASSASAAALTQEQSCPVASGVAINEGNANIWINDMRTSNVLPRNTVPRIFAKHIGEDMVFVGAWRDTATNESYNALTLANVPVDMAQRVMMKINGNDTLTNEGQIRVIPATGALATGTYVSGAFAGDKVGTVNLVYFFRNHPGLNS